MGGHFMPIGGLDPKRRTYVDPNFRGNLGTIDQ
jgi:hypothetical protein